MVEKGGCVSGVPPMNRAPRRESSVSGLVFCALALLHRIRVEGVPTQLEVPSWALVHPSLSRPSRVPSAIGLAFDLHLPVERYAQPDLSRTNTSAKPLALAFAFATTPSTNIFSYSHLPSAQSSLSPTSPESDRHRDPIPSVR